MSVLARSVTHAEDDTWAFQCPGIQGSPCGDPGTGRPFHSSGWPTKKIAQARGAQHFAEHKGEGTAASLDEFRAEHGLVIHSDGTRFVQIGELA